MPHTLLLADDSVTIQRVIELTFADEDIKVVAVSDGDQAIERLDAAPPDIVLADIGMPGKNGYEVAQYVRQTPTLSHIPVVLLTGAFEPVDQARATAAGCDGVLAKPFEPQLVIGRVKDLLAKGRTGDRTGDSRAAPPPAAVADNGAVAVAPSATASIPALDEYFDRLDAAFENLSTPPAEPAASVAAAAPPAAPLGHTEPAPTAAAPAEQPAPAPPAPTPAAPIASAGIDWANAAPEQPPTVEGFRPAEPARDVPASKASPQPPVAAAAVMAPVSAPPAASAALASTPEPPAVSAPVAAVPAASLPSLGDAFAALLAAEEGGTPAAAAWPIASHAPAAPVITDEIIDDIVRRVLERLSDTVTRETTADLVSRVAERVVREEIEKIKAAIK